MSAEELQTLAQGMGAQHGDVKAWLLQDGKVTTGRRKADGQPFKLKEVVWTDGTAHCPGTCMGEHAEAVRPGIIYALINPNWKTWKGKVNLAMSQFGEIKELGPVPGTLGQTGQPAATAPPTVPPASVPPSGPSAQADPGTEPPKGPENKNVIHFVNVIRDIEQDVEHRLWEEEGCAPERPRVGLYVKLIWEQAGKSLTMLKSRSEKEAAIAEAEAERLERERENEAERIAQEAVEAYKAEQAAKAVAAAEVKK